MRHTWQHIRRSPYQALATVMVMSLTLFIATLSLLVALGSHKVLAYFETKPQIIAFLKDQATPKDIEEISKKLDETGKVSAQKYISKDEALNVYKEQNKNDPLLLEMVTADILPASLEVSTKEAKSLTQINELLKQESMVEEVVYQKDIVDTLISWTNAIRKTGVVLVVFLAINSLFIILMVIGMKISSKKEEIFIIKLIGASNWYIGRPFILEGAFYGVVGSIFAWGLSYFLIAYATPSLPEFLHGVSILPVSPVFMLEVLGMVSFGGFLVGSVGSLLAVWRYL